LVLTAAYRYGLVGVLIVAGVEAVLIAIVAVRPTFVPLTFDSFQSAYIGILVILLLGVLAERLTHTEREEHALLKSISRENDLKSRRLTGLINSLNQAIYVLDRKGRVLIVNEAGRVLIPSGADPINRKLTDVLALRRSNHPDELIDLLAVRDAPQVRRDLSVIDTNSRPVNLDVTVMPVPAGDSNNDIEYVVICRDITKEHSLDEQREEFISVASHELRTPLTIAEAALSTALLERKSFSERQATLLEKAHRNVVFLAGIVHDLTTLSEAQNDSIPIQLTPVSPAKLLEQLKSDFISEAHNRQLELTTEIHPDTPAVLSTQHHIHEILENFLTNALKYTTKGGVVLKAEPGPNGSARFSVRDTGIGISPADQQHLFNKFFRAEDFRTRQTGGTGMGLYLCLELAQRLNAKIWCESKLNQGSTFFLEVPPFSKLRRDTSEVVRAQVSSLVDQL
ncbi:MAG TPA: ATP-binding protein, partial [Candidatus Saccharimonadia bacterium]